MKLNIEIEGKTLSDLEFALDEVKRKVEETYRSGFDSNEDGSYQFEITGEEEEEEEEEKCDDED